MENYVPKGYTFPDQDWWEEKRTDVSFLYVHDDESLISGNTPECIKSEENWEEGSESVSEERQDLISERKLSRNVLKPNTRDPSGGSKMQLDTWIEESRQEMKVPPMYRSTGITTLAGYVNLAYPIMSSLKKRKLRGSCSQNETKNKDLTKQMQQVSANLQHVSATLNKIQEALDRSHGQLPANQYEPLKNALHLKSTRIVENYELINVLMNMVLNAANIPHSRKESFEINRTFGSSVDLI
uniref:Protein INCA1 n=1 Tax=Lygus hesperus TaxID=30085 RepID=A0A0A9W7X7_LYGHE